MTYDDRNRIIAALYRPGMRDWPWWTTAEIATRTGLALYTCAHRLKELAGGGVVVADIRRRGGEQSSWRASEGLKRAFPDGPPRITRRLTANFDQTVKARGVAK